MATLKKGDQAPDFELLDQNGKMVKLSDFRGRKFLLYFYVKADTPLCTTQACSVRDAAQQFSDLNVPAIGISPDAPDAQKTFEQKHKLNFPLLSDASHKIADAYGVWGEITIQGKKMPGVTRSSFLIDEEGKIMHAWYNVTPEDTVPKAMEALGSMARK